MKKQILSFALLLSVLPIPSLYAHDTERNLVPAIDTHVLQAVKDSKEQLVVNYIELLQKNRDHVTEIHNLKATIEERAAQIAGGRILGWSVGSAVLTGIVAFLAGRSTNSSSRY